jgi:hypothetical protein
MEYNKESSKEPKRYLKRNGAPLTPETSTRLSPCLKKYLKRKSSPFTPDSLTRKHVSSPSTTIKATSTTREGIANDSLKYRFRIISFPIVCIYISSSLLDDDSERYHQIIKKQGRPSKNQRKRKAATAPKYIKKHGTYYRVINVFLR